MMPRIFSFLLALVLLWNTGCTSLEPLLASLTPPSPVPTRRPTDTPAPPTATVPAEPSVSSLRVWLPAEFNPDADSPEAELLARRLEDFEQEHEPLRIEVRVKSAEVEGDILNALSLTSAAAPSVLPDLILLSRSDLEAAAVQGLLHPMDGLSTALDDPNWYGYAQQLGYVQNTGYGLPFLGDTLVMVYYPELGQIVTWEDIFSSTGQLVFPAGNPQALVGLSLYASAGGDVQDAQGLPTLEQDVLTRVLELVAEGRSRDVFPASLANVTNEAQVLQIYRGGDANKGIIRFLSYHEPSDGAIAPLPGLDSMPFSYSTGWVWALAGANPENQQLAVQLAEYLVADDFLGEWTQATGYLPTRPSIVEDADRSMTAILESAHPIPSSDVLTVLGPLIQEAISRVLNGEPAEDVAGSVLQKLR